jgi:hypothetical protein
VRRLAGALGLSVLVLTLAGAPALAKADKIDLPRSAANNVTQGVGTAIFNNSAGSVNLELTVQLRDAKPDFTYSVYLFVDGAWYHGAPVGDLVTNGQGNGTFHFNGAVSSGEHGLTVDVALPVSGSDQYYSPTGVVMTFK